MEPERQLCWGNGPCAQAHMVSPSAVVLVFVLHCVKRHDHPSHSVQPVVNAASQTAFVEAAESKASTVCLINDLGSSYERVPVSLHQGERANLMINLPSFIASCAQAGVVRLSERSGRFRKNPNGTIWKGHGRKTHHTERQQMPFLEVRVDRKEGLSFIFRKILSPWQYPNLAPEEVSFS